MILPKVENNHDEVWMIFLFGKKYRVFECFLLLENIYLVINVFKITLQFRRSKSICPPPDAAIKLVCDNVKFNWIAFKSNEI